MALTTLPCATALACDKDMHILVTGIKLSHSILKYMRRMPSYEACQNFYTKNTLPNTHKVIMKETEKSEKFPNKHLIWRFF
jgi:hypothetical protein